MGEPDHGKAAPCIRVSFWCADRHETLLHFAVDAEIPEIWDCPRCGKPAGQNEHNPPAPQRAEPYKTHLAYVKERRSAADGAAILAAALDRLRGTASTPAPAPLPAATARDDCKPAEQPPPPATSSPGNPEPVGCRRCRPDGCKGCGYRPAKCTCPGGPRSL
jgi:hypothetical protein